MVLANSSNVHINRIIGRVGFDRITLTKLIAYDRPFPVPVSSFLPDQSVLSRDIPDHMVYISPQKVRISGPGYTFSYGNQSSHPFEKIELHASKDTDDNIQNMTVEDVWNHLDEAACDLKQCYDLHLGYDRSLIRVYEAEINVTFPLCQSFNQYKRLIKLTASAAGASKKAEVTGPDNKLETYYLQVGKTKNIYIYDKSLELMAKENKEIDCDCSLMRCEIRAKEQILSKMSQCAEDVKHHVLHLIDLNDNILTDFFTTTIGEFFDKLDSRIAGNLKFDTPFCSPLSVIFSYAVKRQLRNDPASFAEEILRKFYCDETTFHSNVILDVTDLLSAFRTLPLEKGCIELLTNAFQLILDHPENYDESCNEYIGQRKLYEELREKLCHEHTYEMTLFDDLNMSGDGTKKLLVWWDNPSHTQIPVQNMDPSSVYWQINHMLSNFKQQYHGYAICKSSNASPLIYARKDCNDQYDAYIGTDIALFKDTFWDEAKIHAVQNSANATSLEGDMLCDQNCQIFNDPVPYEDYG